LAKNTLTDLEAALRQLVADLNSIEASYALVGGLAVSIRAEPRLTRDADVAVSVKDDAQAEAVIRQLIVLGYRPGATIEHETTRRLAAIRLTHDDRPATVVDLLFASSGVEPEIVDQAEELEVLPDLVVPVARCGHLIAMKLLARDDRNRPADYDDLLALADVANEQDLSQASAILKLITTRGYNRGRDLEASLEELRSQT
jgi:Nucleotidyl transferase AbiEii toxin, Type IV TA system